MRVLVPFGPRQLVGIVLKVHNQAEVENNKLKAAIRLLDDEPVLDAKMLKLMEWASDYYQHPIGETLSTALPNALRKAEPLPELAERRWRLTTCADVEQLAKNAKSQHAVIDYLQQQQSFADADKSQLGFTSNTLKTLVEKGLIESYQQQPEVQPNIKAEPSPLKLNAEQKQLISDYDQQVKGFQPILLEGVTGSGKTEIYLQLIERTLARGQQALVLVPEIGLTPQTLQRFAARFHCPMAIFHSNLTDKQRLLHWQQARLGIARIIIGTRSALFTACDHLGLIIIDEEHDLSYKQQDGLRYSARDLAIVRAKLLDIPIVLGSATPTLESLYNAEQGKYRHWQLTQRAGNAQPPQIQLVDIRHQPMRDGIAESVLPYISDTLSRGEQVLVFLNRRGFAPSLICHDCGWVSQCHACDARLTIHLQARHLRCHHCQSVEPIPQQCPHCHSRALVYHGTGTERVENALRQHFPDTPLYRIDRDTTSSKQAMPTMLENIHQHDAAILVGTQMLAKGHHFPRVSLVLILEADAALMGTDYRAMERFGQLLTQVIGRAGRADIPGTALIQTHYPDHAQLGKLVSHGYHRFAMDLLAERRQIHLPPFSYQALVRLEDQNPEQAIHTLMQLQQSLAGQPCTSLGPFPAALQRRAHFFRYQLLLQANSRSALKHSVSVLIQAGESLIKGNRQRWSVDVDPQDFS